MTLANHIQNERRQKAIDIVYIIGFSNKEKIDFEEVRTIVKEDMFDTYVGMNLKEVEKYVSDDNKVSNYVIKHWGYVLEESK